jgi:hypothetical protein
LVVPPCQLTGLALVVEAVLAAWHGVQINDDVHVVLGDSILSNAVQSDKLLASVVVVSCKTWHVRPVANGDAKSVDAKRSKVIDVLCCDVFEVTFLEERTAFGLAKCAAKAIFVDCGWCVLCEEVWIDVVLQKEPATKVDAVGLVVLPSREGVRLRENKLGASPRDDSLDSVDEDTGCNLQEVGEWSSDGRAEEGRQISLGDRGPRVRKSAGDRNSEVAMGSSVSSAGSSAFKGIELRSSVDTSTGIVTLTATTSAMLVAWGTSSGEVIVVDEVSDAALTVCELDPACGRAEATLKRTDR